MKKSLLKWMMAIAIVATPMVFTACGSDDDDNKSSGDTSKKTVTYTVSEYVSSTTESQIVIATVKETMLRAMCSSVGQTYNPNQSILGMGYAIAIAEGDESKMLNALDAAYSQLKDTDMKGGYLELTLKKGEDTLKNYIFGTKATSQYVDFEDATLNSNKYWIGSQDGTEEQGAYGPIWKCTYKEGVASVNTTFGGSWWSGFAISACTGTTFADNYQGTDQYNNIVGGASSGNNFLVINGVTASGNSITFDKPATITGFRYTNSAVAANSIINGDTYSGGPFTENDWFKCIVTGTKKDGTTVTYDIMLAENGDYVKTWTATKGLSNTFVNIVKMEFSFDGTRKGEYGLNTPAYMCLDKIVLRY